MAKSVAAGFYGNAERIKKRASFVCTNSRAFFKQGLACKALPKQHFSL